MKNKITIIAFLIVQIFLLPVSSMAATTLHVAIDFKTLVRSIPPSSQYTVSDLNLLVKAREKFFAIYPGVIELTRLLEKDTANVSLLIIVKTEDQELANTVLPKISDSILQLQARELPADWTPQNSVYFKTLRQDNSLHHFELFYLHLLSVIQSRSTLVHLESAIQNSVEPSSPLISFIKEWSKQGYAANLPALRIENATITGCKNRRFDLANATVIDEELALADATCLQYIKSLRHTHAWMDKSRKSCGEFYDGYLFGRADTNYCSGNLVAEKSGASFVFQSALSQLNLSHLNRNPTVIRSVALPRTSAPLFRGIRNSAFHYDPPAILRGMLGLERYAMQTRVFGNKAKNEQLSVDETISALGDYFSSQSTNELKDQHTNVHSKTYKDWSDDTIFGTLFYELSTHYSTLNGLVLAFHDYFNRGIDLNYATNSLGNLDKKIDAGEYLMPLLIDESEIDGLIMPKTQQAYFRIVDQGRVYVLIYQDAKCIFKNPSDENIYTCKPYSTHNGYTPHQKPEQPKKIATASAVMVACKTNETCLPPDATFLQKHSVMLEPYFKLDIDLKALSDSKHSVKIFWQE